MADRYWVGGTGNWNDTARWSTSSGGSSGASVPTSADNVFFDDASAAGIFTVTINTASAVCGAFNASGITNAARKMTLTGTTSVGLLSVNGSWTNPATSFFGWTTWTGAIVTFAATGTITTNAVSFAAAVTINGSGITSTLGGAFTTTLTITLTNGSLNTSGSNFSLTATNITITANSNTRTLTLNASAVALSATTPYTDSSTGGYTLTAGTSTITCSAASPTFAGGGKTFYNVTFSSASAGAIGIAGANTFNNLTFNSKSAPSLLQISLSADQTVSGALTFGTTNSANGRMFVFSNTIGTTRTITLNGSLATLSDVDFRNITAAGTVATPWTGTRLGNCLGNSNITFTTAAPKYWVGGTGSWSTASTNWATASNGSPSANNFPLAQDTCYFDNNSGAAASVVTINGGWNIGTIDFSGRTTNSITLAAGSTTPSVYGDWVMSSQVTLTGAGAYFFLGQGLTQNITSIGKAFPAQVVFNVPTGTVKLLDNTSATSTTTLVSGTFDLNGKTYTGTAFTNTGTATRAITFNGGTISLSAATVSAWNASGSGFTSSAGTGNGTITMTAATAKTFVGGGFSYAATLNQGGAGTLTISGSNTFYDITATTLPSTITFTAGTTQTVTQFTASGTAGNLLTLNSSSPGTPFTLSDASGTVSVSYVSITDSTATGGATWNSYLTNGNVDGGGNTGWAFNAPVTYSYSSDIKLRSMAQRGRF